MKIKYIVLCKTFRIYKYFMNKPQYDQRPD